MKETDKARVAMTLDMRGRVLTKNNKQRAEGSIQICLQVQTKHSEIAQWLAMMTGTEPREREQSKISPEVMRRSCVQHCPEAHVHVDTLAALPLITTWTVSGVAAAIVLWNVRKYMVTSREPWDWVMEQAFRQMKLRGPGSSSTRQVVQRLSALGWNIPPALRQFVPRELEAAR